jgi:hypothetical protein
MSMSGMFMGFHLYQEFHSGSMARFDAISAWTKLFSANENDAMPCPNPSFKLNNEHQHQ